MNNFQFSIFNFQKKRGFALLVSVIFMSVMLALGLALASLGYKQQILASAAIESQYAFYAADAGLECALSADQQQNLFDYASHSASNPPNAITCDNAQATALSYSYSATQLFVSERLSLDSNTRCADVTVYKPSSAGTSYLFSQGYDVSCATVASPGGARFVSRGISVHYGSSLPNIVVLNDGSCASTHYSCVSGSSVNNASGATSWTWSCTGANEGITASCSEPKLLGGGGSSAVAMPLTGYAWSSNIGWISFSGSNYGVSEYKTTGVLSGYAWSSNIGWISFNASDGTHSAPKVNFTTDKVSGWVRACAAFADKNACSGALDSGAGGWDGWIALSGIAGDSSPYGITQSSTCIWTGYAWGSAAIGAISVSGTAADSSPYGVRGNDPATCGQ